MGSRQLGAGQNLVPWSDRGTLSSSDTDPSRDSLIDKGLRKYRKIPGIRIRIVLQFIQKIYEVNIEALQTEKASRVIKLMRRYI